MPAWSMMQLQASNFSPNVVNKLHKHEFLSHKFCQEVYKEVTENRLTWGRLGMYAR